MKLYTKPIKVCNLDYEVVNEDEVLLNGEKANGYIIHDKAEIHIDKNLPLFVHQLGIYTQDLFPHGGYGHRDTPVNSGGVIA